MKYLLLISSLFAFHAMGQKVNYKVIKDEPVEPNISISLDLLQVDLNSGIQNLRTENISINVGLFGYVKILPNLEVDYNLHKSYLTLGKIGFKDYPGNTDLNTGINFLFPASTKTKKTKVVLDKEVEREFDKEVTTSTFITIPATYKRRAGVRGGLRFKNGPFNFRDYNDSESYIDGLQELGMMSMGIYGGVMLRSIRNIVIEDEVYGTSFNSLGADIYLDVLINPVNRFIDLNTNNEVVSEEVKDARSTFPIGFRIGYETFQVEHKSVTGRRFGITGIGEFGYQPYRGFFINAGIGISLFRK